MTAPHNHAVPGPEFQQALGHHFGAPDLLEAALSHRSLDDRERSLTNLRLEFLGDSVLNIVAATYLYKKYPAKGTGELSQMRSVLVSNKSLSRAARKIGLGDHLQLGKGQERMQGRINQSILANCLEAVFGALYLDAGLEKCSGLAERLILEESDRLVSDTRFQNYKSILLEQVQRRANLKPVYSLVRSEGPEHRKTFTVNVKIKHAVVGTGRGPNKMEAEQRAARQALDNLKTKKGGWNGLFPDGRPVDDSGSGT